MSKITEQDFKDATKIPKKLNDFQKHFNKQRDRDYEMWYKNEISVRENILLHAWYVTKAIERLEEKKGISKRKIKLIKKIFDWAYTWEKEIKNKDMLGIEEHLEKVCKHSIDTYGIEYKWNWLLYFDETLYDRLVGEYFPYLRKKEEKDLKQEMEVIDEI